MNTNPITEGARKEQFLESRRRQSWGGGYFRGGSGEWIQQLVREGTRGINSSTLPPLPFQAAIRVEPVEAVQTNQSLKRGKEWRPIRRGK